jgi:hypothetical protein
MTKILGKDRKKAPGSSYRAGGRDDRRNSYLYPTMNKIVILDGYTLNPVTFPGKRWKRWVR